VHKLGFAIGAIVDGIQATQHTCETQPKAYPEVVSIRQPLTKRVGGPAWTRPLANVFNLKKAPIACVFVQSICCFNFRECVCV